MDLWAQDPLQITTKLLGSLREATGSDHNLTGRASQWRAPCNPTLNHTCYRASSWSRYKSPQEKNYRKVAPIEIVNPSKQGTSAVFIGIDSSDRRDYF